MWKSTTPTKLQLCWTTTDAVSFLSADKQVIDISNSGSFLSPHSLSWGCKCVYPYGYIFIITHFYYHACYGHCFTMSMLSFLYTLALYGLMNSLFSQCYDLFKLTLPPDYFNNQTSLSHNKTVKYSCIYTRVIHICLPPACTTLPLCFTCKLFIISVHPEHKPVLFVNIHYAVNNMLTAIQFR